MVVRLDRVARRREKSTKSAIEYACSQETLLNWSDLSLEKRFIQLKQLYKNAKLTETSLLRAMGEADIKFKLSRQFVSLNLKTVLMQNLIQIKPKEP